MGKVAKISNQKNSYHGKRPIEYSPDENINKCYKSPSWEHEWERNSDGNFECKYCGDVDFPTGYGDV